MQLKYFPDDPHMLETLLHLAQYSLESPQSNVRVLWGSVTLSLTASTLGTAPVTFKDPPGKNNKPFAKGVTPTLFLFVNPSTTSSKNTPSYASLTNTGFTAQCYSDTTQSVTLNYLAIGQVGGA